MVVEHGKKLDLPRGIDTHFGLQPFGTHNG